jgi:hypothetical protein
VKGLEKLTTIRLAEVLTQRGVVETDAITDALYAQDRQGEVFVDILVSGGHVTEWDLAKIVVEHFQLPFIMASSLEVPEKAKDAVPRELLFKHRIVPIGAFENIVTVVLPILTPYELLAKVEQEAKCELFPYVGLISENVRVLTELYPDFAPFVAAQAEAKERRLKEARKAAGPGEGGKWMDIFDSADASVRNALKGKGGG